MDFRQAFARSVRVHGGAVALVAPDGTRLTYRELDRLSSRLRAAVEERIGRARLAVLAENSPAAVAAMIAGHKRGVATVQLPFRGSPGELVRMAETAGADGLLFDDANAGTARAMIDRMDLEMAVRVGEDPTEHRGVASYGALLAEAPDEPDVGAEPPAGAECSVFYTSGTTSQPKAVPFRSRDMWLGAIQGVMEHAIDPGDTAVVATPWYHMVTAAAWLYPHFVAGATCVLESGFDAREVLERIETTDATGLLAVPTQLDALAGAQTADPVDLDSLSYIRTAGAILPESLVERTRSLLCANLVNSYGMTEAGPDMTFARPATQDDRPGTVGKESHTYEIRVVETAPIDDHPDPTATVGAGEEGELIARGPGMADGYIDNPDAEARSFFDGWLRTRDVARIDDEGYLYIVGRIDNMFTSGGENIYPAEVEHALETHPAVEEALVFGLEDDHWGHRVAAVIVRDGSVDADALDRHCTDAEGFSNYKRPREYAFRSAPLPRTDTGTVERERVIAEHFG